MNFLAAKKLRVKKQNELLMNTLVSRNRMKALVGFIVLLTTCSSCARVFIYKPNARSSIGYYQDTYWQYKAVGSKGKRNTIEFAFIKDEDHKDVSLHNFTLTAYFKRDSIHLSNEHSDFHFVSRTMPKTIRFTVFYTDSSHADMQHRSYLLEKHSVIRFGVH